MSNLRRWRARDLAPAWPYVGAVLALGLGVSAPILTLGLSSRIDTLRFVDPLFPDAGAIHFPLRNASAVGGTIADVQTEALRLLLNFVLAFASLFFIVSLVALVALLLARSSVDRPEVAIRMALGARRRQLAGRSVVGAAVPILAGSALGVVAGLEILYGLNTSWPTPRAPWGALDIRGALGGVWGSLSVAALGCVLMPLLGRVNLARRLAAGDHAIAESESDGFRRALVVGQIAAGFVVLLSAGLLLRAVTSASGGADKLGWDPSNMRVIPFRTADAPVPVDVYEAALKSVEALPGVVDTSLATPGARVGIGASIRVTTLCEECSVGTLWKPVNRGRSGVHAVSPGFFVRMGAPLVRGREFSFEDRDGAAETAVINTYFANLLFPNGDPIGKRVRLPGVGGEWYTVVGVAGDIRGRGIGVRAEPTPMLYLSALQHPPVAGEIAVRVSRDAVPHLVRRIEQEIRAATGGRMVTGVPLEMEAYLSRFRAPLTWFALLFTALAAGALLLTVSTLHSLATFDVERRRREIGLRLAVGARPRDVIELVLRETLRVTALGIGLGLFGALPLARLLQLQFQGVEPFDLGLSVALAVVLGGAVLAGSYRAACRAGYSNPHLLLRGG